MSFFLPFLTYYLGYGRYLVGFIFEIYSVFNLETFSLGGTIAHSSLVMSEAKQQHIINPQELTSNT